MEKPRMKRGFIPRGAQKWKMAGSPAHFYRAGVRKILATSKNFPLF